MPLALLGILTLVALGTAIFFIVSKNSNKLTRLVQKATDPLWTDETAISIISRNEEISCRAAYTFDGESFEMGPLESEKDAMDRINDWKLQFGDSAIYRFSTILITHKTIK